jgi:NAD(P)-dependent dehydrogenase (short-subunit alcohol dehydrogenase family)
MNTVFSKDCLSGGIYLVTGASSGIGQDTARLISKCGGRVILSGRNESRLNETFSSLEGKDHAISTVDLVDADQTAEWMKNVIAEHGTLSGVFHSAGVGFVRPIRLVKQAQINDVLGSSLFAAFGIARIAAKKNAIIDGGSLVFMSSVAGFRGQKGMATYSAAKAAIDGIVRPLACEMAERRIRVNSIVAGAVHTPILDNFIESVDSTETIAEFENSHLFGFGDVRDVSNAAVFLLSSASNWITGTSLIVDGGYVTCK